MAEFFDLDQLNSFIKYLHYRLTAKKRFSSHSPFLLELVNEVFRDNRHYYAFDEIEDFRSILLKNKTAISTTDYGAGSKNLDRSNRKVKDFVHSASIPVKYGKLLFRLVNHFQPNTILELGTGTGISTLYMAKASSNARTKTLEGNESLVELARINFHNAGYDRVQVINGNFEETLTTALSELKGVDFLLIDGDHRGEALLSYFNTCLPYLHSESIVVLDDIYWSKDMEVAWKQISRHSRVSLSLDLYRMGILFFKNELKQKMELKLLY